MFPDCPGASRGLWRGYSTLLWLMPTASTSSSSNREMILTTKPPPTSTAVGYTGAARSSHFSQSAKQTVFKDMLGEKLWSYQTSAENSSNTSFLCGSGTVCCREQLCFATFTQRKRSCVRAAGLRTYTKPHFEPCCLCFACCSLLMLGGEEQL